jgi:hypothetical protein
MQLFGKYLITMLMLMRVFMWFLMITPRIKIGKTVGTLNKGETMFTITNDQLKAIKRALDLLDVKLLDNHTPAQLNTLLDAFEAFDTVLDDQQIEGEI